MKGKRKGKFGFILLLLLLAAVLGACIYFYPVWKSAGILKEHVDTGHFVYELDIELDREGMEPDQAEVLENIAKLTGYEEDTLFRLTIKGSVWEDRIHALLYPKGAREPLMELYLSDDVDVINETLPYNTIRGNLAGKYELLDYLMPAEMEAVYMTLEQAEQIFELDLSGVREFSLPDSGDRSRAGYFLLLALASKEKQEQGYRYEIAMDQARLEAEIIGSGTVSGMRGDTVAGTDSETAEGVSSGKEGETVRIELEMENPGETAEQNAGFLSRLGIELPVRELRMLKSLSAVIMPGTGEKLTVPAKIMDQEKVELIMEIKELIKKISAFFS